MARDNIELARGKYTKVESPDESASPTLRPSLEASYRRSNDSNFSDEEDVDEFDPLNYDAGTLKRTKDRSSRHRSNIEPEPAYKKRQSWAKRWLVPSKFGCFLLSLFFACVFLLLGAGGFWAYKYKPPGAVASDKWYPAPRGGTDQDWADAYAKAAKMVRQMTLPEKVNITTGTGWRMGMCVGNTGPVERLGFPSLCLQDGPIGIRFARNITAFPAGITIGATWNADLMFEHGQAHGKEARLKGINVLLGPTVGPIGRSPMGGRNWEGFGADPVLQGIAAAQTIRGIQGEHVMATIKHFVGNEQEHFRRPWEWLTPYAISSNMDDRTLHEMYAWPFAEAVKAGVASVMCSYNQINNSYACQNSKLMNSILKDELGFQGFVQSDWLAQRSGVPSALAGLDMSMPGDGLKWEDGLSLWGPELTKAALNGSVPMERLNDMVARIVASWYQVGQDDKKKFPEDGPNFSSWTQEKVGLLRPGSDDVLTGVVNKFVDAQGKGKDAHKILARKIAAEGTVLVKNEGNILPLKKSGGKPKMGPKYRVGIYGEDATVNPNGPNNCPDRGCNRGTLGQGWGSASVEYPYLVAPDEALMAAFNNKTVKVSKFTTQEVPKLQKGKFLHNQDLCIVFANADSGEGYIQPQDQIAGDRNDLRLAKRGEVLIKQIASECGGDGSSPTIVVLHTVGPVLVDPWINLPGVKAVLFAHLPGQESGNAIADILFGAVNPSGRLPYTIGKKESDYGPSRKIIKSSFPDPLWGPQQNFTEGLYIDYRYFDKHNIQPRYEFGYGLSYTTFRLSSLMIQPKLPFFKHITVLPPPENTTVTAPDFNKSIPDAQEALFPVGFRKLKNFIYPYIDKVSDVSRTGRNTSVVTNETVSNPASSYGYQGGHPGLYEEFVEVSASLTNTGDRDGSSVVQLYVSFPQDYHDSVTGKKVDFPVKVLRNFKKIHVPGGNRRAEVIMSLTRKDLSYWSPERGNWVFPERGTYKIMMGFSSRDIPMKMTGTLD
ncbi:hypothetical protein NA57DRAFT_40041 [Rhizodiscina lignyota]|uniref:Probable beta-glucosidase E n=1 Tax=Rhizodiscina lignyota TaxID=1504668 RepID=A0A9P4IFK3_9PEZI|nr:hypothetical protein NA57DRAFT_40041 [Rhizodiscina lignyota]